MSMPFNVDDDSNNVLESWESQRLDELASLVAGLAGRDDIQLQFGTRWAWSASEKKVLVPKADLANLSRCRAIASHEVGHVLFTRHMKQLGLTEETAHIPDVFLHFMHNVFEDPRVENGVGQRYPGAHFWLQQLHAEEEANAEILKEQGLPKAMEFFYAHLREYHRDWQSITHETSERIGSILDQTRSDRELLSTILPNTIAESGDELDLAFNQEVLPRLDVDSVMMSSLEQCRYLAQARMMQVMEGSIRKQAFLLYQQDEQRIQQMLNQMKPQSDDDLQELFKEAFKLPEGSFEDAVPGEKARRILREWYQKQQQAAGVCTEQIFRRSRNRNDNDRRRRRRGGQPSDETQTLIRTYDQMRSQIANQIQKMTQELQNVLRPTKATKWRTGYTSGSKVNIRRMIQLEARNQGELDFWQRKTQVDKRNVAATLLIDLSGSMTGPKSEAALQGAILFWESLTALGVATSISGFKTERIPIINFGESIALNSRKKVANMLNMVGSVNHDAIALNSAFTDLIAQPADEHVLIVISDGQPVGDNAEADLHAEIAHVKNHVHLIGLGLGEDTEHVTQFYPHAIGSIPVASLSKQIGAVLQKVLRRR